MKLPIKKTSSLKCTILFFCFFAYPINKSLDDAGWSFLNHTCDTATHIHETFITYHDNYDKYVQQCISKETQDREYYSNILLYHNEPDAPDVNPSSDNSNNSDLTSFHDLLNDSRLETRRQEIGESQTAQVEVHNNKNFCTTGKIIQELKIPKDRPLYLSDLQDHTFDSTIILRKVDSIKDLVNALNSPIVKARFERIKRSIENRNIPKKGREHRSKKELDFLDLLISGKVTALLEQIMDSDLNIIQSAFDELKQLWPWKRDHTFLAPDLKSGTGEPGFVTAVLNVDLMEMAEKTLITHKDYIAKHATEQEQQIIQGYTEKCYELQQKGNSTELFNQKEKLRLSISKNPDQNGLVTLVCFAIVDNCYLDPITRVFNSIARTQSLEKACDHVKNLEKQIVTQAEQHGILHLSKIRTWITEYYGYDVLEAAHNCYKSRADYVYTPNNQSYLSDPAQPILHNIESKDLLAAHAELVNLDKQINQALADHNITEPVAQKAFIEKVLGRDVSEVAHKKYESRADHKKLVESFVDIDVNKSTGSILQNNTTYESVAGEMSNLAERIFGNARLCNLRHLPKIEAHVHDSIDAMKIAQDHPTFIFNLSMVNHTLGDIQQLAHAVLSGTHPVMQQSSELLMSGLKAFFEGLDPVTQIKSMGHLAMELGSILDKGGSALWNDPILVLHNGMNATCSLIDLIRSTADFTSDLTVGRLYLSQEDYQQRIDTFCALTEPLRGVTGKECFQFAGRLAADVLFTKGLGIAYTFLKEIDALGKLGGSAARVAGSLKKGFDAHLGDYPIMITAEGIPIRNFAPKMVECMEIAGQQANSKKIIEIAVKQLPKNQDRLLKVVTQFKSIKLQSTEAVFLLDKKGLKHILSRHHPKYWDGSIKAGQSFFSKKTKIEDIIEVVTKILEQNKGLITTLKDSKKFQITGTVNGVQYVLGTKNGRIGQLYPLLK